MWFTCQASQIRGKGHACRLQRSRPGRPGKVIRHKDRPVVCNAVDRIVRLRFGRDKLAVSGVVGMPVVCDAVDRIPTSELHSVESLGIG